MSLPWSRKRFDFLRDDLVNSLREVDPSDARCQIIVACCPICQCVFPVGVMVSDSDKEAPDDAEGSH